MDSGGVAVGSATQRSGRLLTGVVALAFAVAVALSVIAGTPDRLPGIALGWPTLLHIERAFAVTIAVAGLAIFLLRGWRGDLPIKVSTTGVEWAQITVDFAEALGKVDTQMREVIAEMQRRLPPPADPSNDALPRQVEKLDEQIERTRGMTAALSEALGRLPDTERSVIALHYFLGLTTQEIADRLDTSPAAVRVILARASARLRDEVREH